MTSELKAETKIEYFISVINNTKKRKEKKEMSNNLKVKQEADRACASINSYHLKVFALTVNLAVNLTDMEEVKNSTSISQSADDQLECTILIRTRAPECSVLIISEGKNPLEEVRILAYSRNTELNAEEWALAAANNMK